MRDRRHHGRVTRVSMITIVALLSHMTESTADLTLNARLESFTTATSKRTASTTNSFN
ncbi:hypothetical protein V6Z11_D11G354200 [Gossypium hirsutum]